MASANVPGTDTGRAAKVEQLKHELQSQVSQTTEPDGGLVSKPGGVVMPKDRERKIGHRRVDGKTGTVTYKKKPTSELMAAIQFGIGQSIGGLSSKPDRDLLMQDFPVVESVVFPSEGSNLTPAHHYSDFRFKTFAPVAFRYFRELFNIRPEDFMLSLCDDSLIELSNPGAGGSIFYITEDDEFIIKTAQHKEADFLQKLLAGYYMNLNQNPRTLLPKFYGLYCYQCGGKNIRFVVMNNILPSTVKMHEKYDLKGSTYKRKASKTERAKSSPTLKDLDFMQAHPEGLLMEKETCEALIKTIQRDCRVLESFKIMDYSLLVGVHNLDVSAKEKRLSGTGPGSSGSQAGTSGLGDSMASHEMADGKTSGGISLQRAKSMRAKVTQYSTPMESIHVAETSDEFKNEDIPPGGIPAKNAKGERLLLFLGVIDILQRYRFKKKFEHTLKSMITDGETVSVTRPSFYAERFQAFFHTTVFRKAPSPLKHSPSKRKSERSGRTVSISEEYRQIPGTVGGRPDLLIDSSTPPPTFDEALSTGRRFEKGFQTIPQQEVATSRVQVTNSPLSITESTPTCTDFTEGTPSYTASSPSCSSEVLDATVPSLPLEIEDSSSIDPQGSFPGSPVRSATLNVSGESSYVSAVSDLDTGVKGQSVEGGIESQEATRSSTLSMDKHSEQLGVRKTDDKLVRVSFSSDRSMDTTISEQSDNTTNSDRGLTDSMSTTVSEATTVSVTEQVFSVQVSSSTDLDSDVNNSTMLTASTDTTNSTVAEVNESTYL